MPKQILNGIDYANGIDQAKLAKIGDATLNTTAQDLSGAVNELKSNLTSLTDSGNITLSNSQKIYFKRYLRVVTLKYSNSQSASVSSISGLLPSSINPSEVTGVKFDNCEIYIDASGNVSISANGWANLVLTYIV